MKKLLFLFCLLGFAGSSIAQTVTFGVGVNAGLAYPIVQDDQGNGTIIGLKVIYSLGSLLTVEPNISFLKYGNPTSNVSGINGIYDGFEGSKITSYGVDAILGGGGGTGLHPYLLAGAGYYNSKRDMTLQDETRLGFSGGLGFELGMGSAFSLDARVKLNVITSEGGGSKKSASASAGINYYFGY